ncbi:MAG: hypothetical protein ACI8XU_002529 [Kiritimatiellia bacterium]|jgi:hypothetical protein
MSSDADWTGRGVRGIYLLDRSISLLPVTWFFSAIVSPFLSSIY